MAKNALQQTVVFEHRADAANGGLEPIFPKFGSAANVGYWEWRHDEYLG